MRIFNPKASWSFEDWGCNVQFCIEANWSKIWHPLSKAVQKALKWAIFGWRCQITQKYGLQKCLGHFSIHFHCFFDNFLTEFGLEKQFTSQLARGFLAGPLKPWSLFIFFYLGPKKLNAILASFSKHFSWNFVFTVFLVLWFPHFDCWVQCTLLVLRHGRISAESSRTK